MSCEKDFEAIAIEVTIPDKTKIFTITIYRSPTGSLQIFSNKLNDALIYLSRHKKSGNIILCRDLNRNSLTKSNELNKLDDTRHSFCIRSLINEPTRVTKTRSLDYIFSNLNEEDITAKVIECNMFDHYAQLLCTKPSKQ